jgi:hypothetical protein
LATCDGAEEAGVVVRGFEDFGGVDGHVAGFVAEGVAFGVDEVELGEAHVFHDAGDRADVAGSGGFDQDDAGLGEVARQGSNMEEWFRSRSRFSQSASDRFSLWENWTYLWNPR